MSIFLLVWNYLIARPLNTALNVLLLSLGIAVITILLLFNNQLEQKIARNARGIDLVVGAKGSPLQLILCNIFHIDFPTGNIKLAEAERIATGRFIKQAIPLALGDSYDGYRIVGTTRDYATLYEATLAAGDWWQKPMEVALGATAAERLGLKLGDTFASSHGLMEGGHTHEDQKFVVKGILQRTHSVVDNLILTGVESVWEVHEHHDEEDEAHEHEDEEAGEAHHHHDHEAEYLLPNDTTVRHSPLVPSVAAGDSTREITAMLLQYRSPMAAIQLPRLINGQTNMQAASPAFETARLFSILGVGVDILSAFAYVLITISALSIFIALYNSLKERRYDLAIMRSMGASRRKLFAAVLLEGTLLTLLGSLAGLCLGHAALWFFATLEESQKAGIDGLIFYAQEWLILAGSLFLGLLCALIPALQAYRTDISRVLAGQ